MAGVTEAWTYFCQPGCHFALHPEDNDLCSFNINLAGGTKVWICVLPEDRQVLERRVKQIFPSLCGDILRHKMFFFPLQFFDTIGVRYIVINQTQGKIVFTLPGCLHQGFNLSPSLHAAVNMATVKWIRHGLLSSEASLSVCLTAVNPDELVWLSLSLSTSLSTCSATALTMVL